jgi:hypothetical protein
MELPPNWNDEDTGLWQLFTKVILWRTLPEFMVSLRVPFTGGCAWLK